MVNRFFKRLFYEETSGLHEAAFLLAAFALLSKILALVRDRFLAGSFGASTDLDVYFAAFRIPDFIYFSLASLVASAVLIPFVAERMGDKEAARRFFNSVFTVFFAAIVLVSAAVFFAMPALSGVVAPGLSGDARENLVLLSRIMLFSPILLGLSGLFASVTQTLRRFFVYALAPVLYNVGIIAGIIFLYPVFGLPGLAYGVIFGALLHVLVQIPVLARYGFLPAFARRIDWHDVRRVLALSLPRTITLSAHHAMLLVLVALASHMKEGSIAIFNLSFNLQSVPLSIIGVSYSIAAFPTLARLFSNGEHAAFVRQVVVAMRHIIFWSLPILALIVVLRAQIVRTILGAGAFDWADTRLTAAALALFVVSTAAQSLMLLFVRGYYAAGRTFVPLVVNLASLALVVAFAFSFIASFKTFPLFRYFIESLFRIEGIAGSEIIMLPLAFSLGVFFNVIALWLFFRRDFQAPVGEVLETAKHSLYAAVVAGFAAHQSLRVFDDVFDINTLVGIFSQGLFSGILGVAAGILVLKLMRNKEIKDVERTLHHKFWKRKPIIPDQSDL